MRPRQFLMAIALLCGASGTAHAVTLTTAPFPSASVAVGSGPVSTVRCMVTNVGTKDGTVSGAAIDATGGEIAPSGPLVVPAGSTVVLASVPLNTGMPLSCRFEVPNKKSFRGSFSWVNQNGTSAVLVPAE